MRISLWSWHATVERILHASFQSAQWAGLCFASAAEKDSSKINEILRPESFDAYHKLILAFTNYGGPMRLADEGRR